jgi:hypothetical protein
MSAALYLKEFEPPMVVIASFLGCKTKLIGVGAQL